MYKEVWKRFYRAARIWVKEGVIQEESTKDLYRVDLALGRAVWSYGEGLKNIMVFAWQDDRLINLGTSWALEAVRKEK
jgi:hypothetical protein